MFASTRNLEGQTALVTGASRGIGAAIALRLAQHGADVAVHYHSSADAAEQVAEQIRSCGSKAITMQADVTKEKDVELLFESVVAEFGRLDIVMSNSGVEHFGSLLEITEAEIDEVLALNVKGQLFVARGAYKHLREYGRLVLTSSVSAQQGCANHAVYAASKAAVQGMTKSLAYDFGTRDITVNCIAAGGIKTESFQKSAAKYFPDGDVLQRAEIEALISEASPLNRLGLPEDIAGIVSLLASPESQWLTGQTFFACGGAFMA